MAPARLLQPAIDEDREVIDLDALAKLPALSVLEIQLIRELGEEREKVAKLTERLLSLQQNDEEKQSQSDSEDPGEHTQEPEVPAQKQ